MVDLVASGADTYEHTTDERADQARARGCDHPHAICILTRAWLRVI